MEHVQLTPVSISPPMVTEFLQLRVVRSSGDPGWPIIDGDGTPINHPNVVLLITIPHAVRP